MSISLSRRLTPTSATPNPQSEPSKTSIRSSKAFFFMGKNYDCVCFLGKFCTLGLVSLFLSLCLGDMDVGFIFYFLFPIVLAVGFCV